MDSVSLSGSGTGRPRASSFCTAVRPPLSISTLSTRAVTQQPRPIHSPFTAFFRHIRFHSRDSSSASSSASSSSSPSSPPSPLPIAGLGSAAEPPSAWKLARKASGPMLLIALLFPISSAAVVLALSTLPITATLPRTLGDLSQLGRELQGYSSAGSSSLLHVLAVLAITASWKHAWSVPGSVLLNVLAGVLLNPILGTIYMTFLTAVGSGLSTLLAKPLAPLIAHVFPKATALTAAALQGHAVVLTSSEIPPVFPPTSISASADAKRSPAWIRLSVLRLIGVVPWSGINIASGVCSVPLWDCFLGGFLGTLPWTAVTVQVGDILMSISQAPSATTTQQAVTDLLTSPAIIAKLVFLTLLSLGPILARGWLSALIGYNVDASLDAAGPASSAAAEKRARTSRSRRWSAWMAAVPLPGRRSSSKHRASGSCEDEYDDDNDIPLLPKGDPSLLSPA